MKKSLPLILIFVALIALWVVYGNIVNPDKDAKAVSGEYKVAIDDFALVIRRETPITVSGQGYFQNIVATQSKVWSGETVGWFCEGEPDSEVVKQLNVINEKIREASMSESTDKALTNDVFSIDNKLLSYTRQISAYAATGNQKAINKIRNEIDLLIERKNSIAGKTTAGKESVLENLERQRAELEAKLGNTRKNLVAPTSGVFVASADGLEKTLNFESVETLTPSVVKEYLSREEYKPDEEIYPYPVCKITDNAEWLLAVVCDENVAAELTVGKRVRVSFPDEGDKTLVCTIYKISEPEEGSVIMYILGTNEIYDILRARKTKINILIDSYEGLKIPASAVKTEEGIDYVLVKKGGGDVRVDVEVLFKDDDFAIVKEGGKLKIYDKVVTE